MLPKVLEKVRRKKLRTSVLIIIGVIVALGLADFFSGIHQLSAYDRGWDDLSKFRSALEAGGANTSAIVSTPLLLNASEGFSAYEKVLVVIGVEKPYLQPEIDTILDFVDRGGFLILADDFGYGNGLARKLGVAFSGNRLYSAAFQKNPAFVQLNATLGGAEYGLLLDKPTILEGVSSSEALAFTYPDSWLDENGNGERDFDEESNTFPMVAVVGRGDGYALVVSDPGLFINDMWDRSDNGRYILACIQRYFPGARDFIFEESRHKPETIREGAWRTGLLLEVLALNNIYGKAVLAVLSLLAVGIGALSVKTPAEWRHEDTLSEITHHYLAQAMFRPEDRARLRAVLLEKMRISMNLYLDEFGQLDPKLVRGALKDPGLVALYDEPDRVDLKEMERLTALVRGWSGV